MSKLIWAGMAGFLCGVKYREMGRRFCWKTLRKRALRMAYMMKKL